MDPRFFILTALHDALRRMPLDGFGWSEPTWHDGEFIRACKLRFERGDESCWDEFMRRLETPGHFDRQIRELLIELDIVFRDLETYELVLQLPADVATFEDGDREALLAALDADILSKRPPSPIDVPREPKGDGEIMYIEMKQSLSGPARIGRVFFSQTRKTLYYRDLVLKSLKGRGYKANYCDVATGMKYWVSKCKKRGGDTLYPGMIEIDEDVREEYWTAIRGQPQNARLTVIRSNGKY